MRSPTFNESVLKKLSTAKPFFFMYCWAKALGRCASDFTNHRLTLQRKNYFVSSGNRHSHIIFLSVNYFFERNVATR